MLGALVSSWKMWGSQQGRLLSRGGTLSDLSLDPSPAIVWRLDGEWKKRKAWRQGEAGPVTGPFNNSGEK